jgi:hypothetical protein
MIQFPKTFFCKAAAVILAGLLLFQLEFLAAQSGDALSEQLATSRSLFAAGNYPAARTALESLLADLEKLDGWETLKGEAHLFLGAVCEKLLDKVMAIKQYCLAKVFLGNARGSDGIDLNALEFYKEACAPSAPETAANESAYAARFEEASHAFFTENYEKAKEKLEALVAEIEASQRRDFIMGEIYLLSGATYEKLALGELAIKYFCLAKEILGKDRTSSGLELRKFKYYRFSCSQDAVYTAPVKKKSRFMRLLRPLLGLAVVAVGGLFLYTQVIKKKDKAKPPLYIEDEYQAWNCWKASAISASSSQPTIAPANSWMPNPNHNNGYYSQSSVSITGPQIKSWNIKVNITGCNGVTRRDFFFVNGAQVLDVTNRFDRPCGGSFTDFCSDPSGSREYVIASGSGEVTLELSHRIIFWIWQGPTQVQVVNNATFTGR